jgi:DNA primase
MVHEGEKAGEAGAKLLPTWCHVVVAGGASSLRKADWRPVKRVGLHVYLVPDADEAGREAMDVAGQKLAGLGAAVLWLDLFGDDSKRDVADFEGNLA